MFSVKWTAPRANVRFRPIADIGGALLPLVGLLRV